MSNAGVSTHFDRTPFLTQLACYLPCWTSGLMSYANFHQQEEHDNCSRLRDFVTTTPSCFSRDTVSGHVTGSALVARGDLTKVLLTNHRKLNKWLQLGGHGQGEHLPQEIARREVEEESGLQELKFFPLFKLFAPKLITQMGQGDDPLLFDLDIHLIPAHHDVAAHYHYDARYLIIADDAVPLTITEESNALGWFDIATARSLTSERSMIRQFDKLTAIHRHQQGNIT